MSGPPIADAVEELTPEWFTDALRDGGTIDDEAAVTSAESRAIGTGQLGSVVLSELAYEGAPDAPPTLIAKLPSSEETARQMGIALRVYEAEVRFYQELAPLIEMPTPHLHWGGIEPETGRFTLVLDDLSPLADVGDVMAGATREQMELAMRGLAGLQAPLWDEPRLQEMTWLSDLGRTEMLFGAVPQALEPFTERFGDLLEPEHVALARELGPKSPSVVAKIWRPPFVVSHGDYRADNLLFGKTPEAEPLTVIDWQGTRLGIPGLDVAYCLASSLGVEDRRAMEADLLVAYHEALVAAGVEGYALADARASYRAASLWPLLALLPASLTLEQSERG